MAKDPKLNRAYDKELHEYFDLGHMIGMPPYIGGDSYVFYFSDHAVVKAADRKTTKTRVVFNASANTTSDTSLNDLQYTGYALQMVAQIMLRWRMYKHADISYISRIFYTFRILYLSTDLIATRC